MVRSPAELTIQGSPLADAAVVRGSSGGSITIAGENVINQRKGCSGGTDHPEGPDDLQGEGGPDVLRGGPDPDSLHGGGGDDDCDGKDDDREVRSCES